MTTNLPMDRSSVPYMAPKSTPIQAMYVAKKQQNRLYHVFFMILLFSFLPWTPAGQIAPFIFYLGVILYAGVRPRYHLQRLFMFGILALFVAIVYWQFLRQEFSIVSYSLFFVTMSPFIIFLFDFRRYVSAPLLQRLGRLVFIIIVLESIYGTVLAVFGLFRFGTFDGAAGDMVWGTLAPPLNWDYSGRMPIFALLISTLLLFSLAVSQKVRPETIVGYGIVAFCWLLTSLMHSYVYFVVATLLALGFLQSIKVLLTARISKRSFRAIILVTSLLMLFIIGGMIFLPSNTAQIPRLLGAAMEFGPYAKSIKNRATYETVVQLPNLAPFQPFIGLGPGQYASRAALMVSGEYLARIPIPFVQTHANVFTETFILPKIGIINSSVHFPTSSWIAWYGETGILGLILLGLFVYRLMSIVTRKISLQFPRMNVLIAILILYILLLGFQNVYWEYAQAIFPAVVGIKLCLDWLQQENSQVQNSKRTDAVRTA